MEQLLAAGAAVDAAGGDGQGAQKWPVGTTGDAEWVKEQLGDKLFDDFECAMCTELWQGKANRWYLL